MLRFYPAPDTRSIIGAFRSFAADIAATSDQLLGKEDLAERVKRARKTNWQPTLGQLLQPLALEARSGQALCSDPALLPYGLGLRLIAWLAAA